jgi:methyl-accepting chemotaxis protein
MPSTATVLAPFPVQRTAAAPSLEDRLEVVTHLLDELAEGVAALAAEAPKTSARLDELDGRVNHLVAGLSEILAVTQRIAARMDAEDAQ